MPCAKIHSVSPEKTRAIRLREVTNKVSLAAGLLIGLVFLASGSGKLLAPHETPAQIVDFVSSVIPQVLLAPWMLDFLYYVFVPYVMPSAELLLSIALLLGFVPRLAATLCIPLLVAFASTNVWAILQGHYATCASCFGIWENIFGHLTPIQSLTIDSILLLLALTVIVLHPVNFLSSQARFMTIVSKSKASLTTLRLDIRQYGIKQLSRRYAEALGDKTKKIWRNITADWRWAISTIAIFFAIAAATSYFSVLNLTPRVLDVTVAEVSDTTALISVTLNKPEIVTLTLYDEQNNKIGVWSASIPETQHGIFLDELLPITNYHFRISLEDKQPGSTVYSFTTMPPKEPPFISHIVISDLSNFTATITWTTSRPATTEVAYWSGGSGDQRWLLDNELTSEHKVTITDLSPESTYYFRIQATDAYGQKTIAEKEGVFSLAIAPEPTKRAPDFTLQSLDGETVSLSTFKGKVVVLNFWNVWCSACRKEMPIIQEVADKHLSQVVILNIHLGGREDTIRNYLESEHFDLIVLHDKDTAVSGTYNVTQTPTVFVIDNAGIIRLKNPRFSSSAELTNTIQKVLDNPAVIGSTTSLGQQ